MAKYSFLMLAQEVLNREGKPLTPEEIWHVAQRDGFAEKVESVGKTPWASISAQIYVNLKQADTVFVKAGKRPVRFALKSYLTTGDPSIDVLPDILPVKPSYKERQLHPVLSYYAFAAMGGVYTKTILHEKSSKKAFSEWLHPDLVGFYFPAVDWSKEVLDLGLNMGASLLQLYSFELKRQLNFGNLRESFFQAVSNSSWANEGYLVAAEIAHDEEFRSELGRLSASFGIGVIQLDVLDPDTSEVIFPARSKTTLDWETINKLAEQNPDFRQFLADVKVVLQTKRVFDSQFDGVAEDGSILAKAFQSA